MKIKDINIHDFLRNESSVDFSINGRTFHLIIEESSSNGEETITI